MERREKWEGRRRRRRRGERGEGEGEGGGVGMEMERDGASQHDRMTDGLTDEQGGRERERDIEQAAINDARFRCKYDPGIVHCTVGTWEGYIHGRSLQTWVLNYSLCAHGVILARSRSYHMQLAFEPLLCKSFTRSNQSLPINSRSARYKWYFAKGG